MKHSNQKTAQNRKATSGVSRWRKAGSRTLPILGAAMLFGMATPALADSKVSFHVSNAHAHPGRVVERKLNRVVRKVARDLDALQPVSHRDRHDRYRSDRYDRRDYRRDHRRAQRRADRRAERRWDRVYRQQRNARYANPLYADPLYRPMSFKRWSRHQWRLTHDERYVTPRLYQRYLKKYRKHYRHGHEQAYFAGVDRNRRGHRSGRH